MSKNIITEYINPNDARIITEAADTKDGKQLYMSGIFIQGGIRNYNGRIYPVSEIRKAVNDINERIEKGNSVLGECDHPSELTINLERVSHLIEKMWIQNNEGYGKLRILPTPKGNIIRTLLESGVKLGVSSRGFGQVNNDGTVSRFEISTVDIVCMPSAPLAYPKVVYESMYNHTILDLAEAVKHDPSAQKYLTEEIMKAIRSL